MWPYNVRKNDLRIDYYRGSGKGGQKKNKTSNCCRITHIPTGEVASSEEGRSQTKNREAAFCKLAEKLVPKMVPQAPEKEVSRERIRTYHALRQEVIDHRSGRKFNYYDVLEGNSLEEILEEEV